MYIYIYRFLMPSLSLSHIIVFISLFLFVSFSPRLSLSPSLSRSHSLSLSHTPSVFLSLSLSLSLSFLLSLSLSHYRCRFRSLAGIGEGAFGTICPALLSDMFPPELRSGRCLYLRAVSLVRYTLSLFSLSVSLSPLSVELSLTRTLSQHTYHQPSGALAFFYLAIPIGAALGFLLVVHLAWFFFPGNNRVMRTPGITDRHLKEAVRRVPAGGRTRACMRMHNAEEGEDAAACG